MEIFKALHGAISPAKDKFLPYVFHGNWTREEKGKVKATLSVYTPEKVGRMFNTWVFRKFRRGPNQYLIKRSTWTMSGFVANSVDELIGKIHDYYERTKDE